MELKLKKLLLEQACYYCQHNVIQHFMPDDITTYGLPPILPAMAALHSIITSHCNDHETASAVELLQFIHSFIPEPSISLQRDYIDILVSLKSKAVFYEVFSSDHSYADDQHRYNILDRYFTEDDCMDEACSVPEDCSTCEEYKLAMHTSVRHAIKQHLVSEKSRKDFQRNCLLHSSTSMDLWVSLADNVESYIYQIRKMLPVPQHVLDYLRVEEDILGVVNQSNDDDSNGSSSDHPSLAPVPEVSPQNRRVSLRSPCVLVKKLPIKPSYTDYRSSTGTATNISPSYVNHRNNSDSGSNRRPSCTNYRNNSDSGSSRRPSCTNHRNNCDSGSNKRPVYINHKTKRENACNSSGSETTQSETGADQDSDFRNGGEWEQETHTSTKTSISLEGFETPDQVQTIASKLDPKAARVMTSIARKKRFLTGSPATSSDDSSCSFLSLRKPRQVKSIKLARHLSRSFVSPEIPLTTCRPGSLVNPSMHELDLDLRSDNTDVVGVVPPASGPVTIGEAQMDGRRNEPHVVYDHLETIKPLLLQPFNRRLGNDKTHDGMGGGSTNVNITSITLSEPVPSSKQINTVTSDDVVAQPIDGHVLHTNRQRVVMKRTVADLEQDCNFVSDTESESPLRKKSCALQGLRRTLRRAH